MYVCFEQTVLGKIGLLSCKNEALKALFFNETDVPENAVIKKTKIIAEGFLQLNEYFLGKRREFDLPFLPEGTDFQKRVWLELTRIPYGETRSYADVAFLCGRPAACRAVGQANHLNPLPIFIPCHRVIGKNGSLTGYAGGIHIKKKLLDLEYQYKTKG